MNNTEKADVLIIYPPLHRLYGEHKLWMPLSILYLSSYLNEKGIVAKAYNADCTIEKTEEIMSYKERFKFGANYKKQLNLDSEIWKEIKNSIAEVSPKILCLSVLTEALGSATKVIDIARNTLKKVTIVVGGPHAEIASDYFINHLKVDYVIKGDGEESLYNLSTSILDKNSSPPPPKQSVIIQKRPEINELPIPKLEYHYKFEKYKDAGLKMNISTSRGGCIYNCSFCYCSQFKQKLLFREAESILRDIEYYTNHYHTRKLFFIDDTFTFNKKLVREVCHLLIIKKIKVSWTCTTRADCIDKDLLLLMKEAGCKSIHLGVETGSSRLIKMIDKRLNLETISDASKLIKSVGIESRMFFMVGLPSESSVDLEKTMKFISTENPDEVILNVYVPIPGTQLFNIIDNQYMPISQIDWCNFSRDEVPYYQYINDESGEYFPKMEELFNLVEKTNN